MRLLVVEDESIIAQDLAWVIENDLGFTLAGIATSVGDALEIIDREPVDGAILDANLGGESTKCVAEALQRRNAPYFVLSGCIMPSTLPAPLNRAPFLQKPYREKELHQHIRDLAR
jgi:DNA-binding response OmpR family regulator